MTLTSQKGTSVNHPANLDLHEVNKFGSLAARWWEPSGLFAPLHIINPCRLQYIQQHTQLTNKKILDVGCGAGILSESLAKLGTNVTGIDASHEVILAAQQHAANHNLSINYHATTIEDFDKINSQEYDIITCMELLEHVPDPTQMLQDCNALLKPNGKLFLSTLNRTLKSYALAIIGAEYIFNILPKQTHDYKKFIQPSELATALQTANFELQDLTGMSYNPLLKTAALCATVDINYLAYATKKEL